MPRHTIDIDRKLLLECQQLIGAPTLSETVREALRFLVVRRHAEQELAAKRSSKPAREEEE